MDTSVKRTIGSVPLLSVLKRFDCRITFIFSIHCPTAIWSDTWMSHSQLVDAHCVGTNCVVLISKNRIISFTMDKFAKGFLSLLVNGASFSLLLVLLPGISTDKSGACSNIFIYLHWLILSSRTKTCSNFVFVQTEMFCPIRRRTQFTTQFFFFSLLYFCALLSLLTWKWSSYFGLTF